MRHQHVLRVGVSPLLIIALSSVALGAVAHAGTGHWVDGDFFVPASGEGDIAVFSQSGVLKEVIQGMSDVNFFEGGGFAFGPNGGDLFHPLWGEDAEESPLGRVLVYERAHPHARTVLLDASTVPTNFQSIQFDAQGNFYTQGSTGGALDKFTAAGTLLDSFNLTGLPKCMRLAPDQTTMFYTTGTGGIRRYDLATHTPLTNFSTDGDAEFFLLSPFDGSGGAIAADAANIKRFDGTGALVQTYDLPSLNFWLFVQPDRNGTSFWAESHGSPVNLHRFNIATGVEDASPLILNHPTANGFVILGVPQGGTTPAQFDAPTPCATSVMATAGVPVSFTVQASDINAGDVVNLTASGMPNGATLTPDLPSSGNPVSITFDWTPSGTQVGTHLVTFTATDFVGHETTCTATVTVEGPGEPYCFGDGLDPIVTAQCPCTNFGDAGHGCANSGYASGAQLSATGTTSPNTVLFVMTDVPNNNLATGFMNTANALPGGVVFGDGVRCQSGVLIRFGSHNTGSLGDTPNTWSSPAFVVPPGLTRYYQVQYRNPSPAFCPLATFNISNGYRIAW